MLVFVGSQRASPGVRAGSVGQGWRSSVVTPALPLILDDHAYCLNFRCFSAAFSPRSAALF